MVALALFMAALIALLLVGRTIGLFWSAVLFVLACILYLEFGFDPPFPGSVKALYVGVMLLAVLLYVTSADQARDEFFRPIRRLAAEPDMAKIRWAVLVVVPLFVAWRAHEASQPSPVPPPKIRSVHPSPPSSIATQPPGQPEPHTLDLIRGDNPLRPLEVTDPETFAAHVARGRVVYYENCYYCHGDTLAADGHYASALKPPPANFTDPGTIAMLQEAYLYWRIAKGGPGLPDAATPWDSSMPAWEAMLSEEDMWNVIVFMYDYVGYRPRAQVDVEAH